MHGVNVGAADSKRGTTRAEGNPTNRADIDRRPRLEPGAVQPLVLSFEPLDERSDRLAIDFTSKVDWDAPALAAVAHVCDTPVVAGVATHLVIESSQLVDVRPPHVDAAEPDVVKLLTRNEQTCSREQTRKRRHDNRPDAKLARERCCVNRA